ncbi:MAG: cobyrinate a,c-diamide synthase [Lachnospiraceae bacterium]|nr:cobyrinate a,c-diamide synthase [Lachnospiraceae bacterium]
MNKENMPDLPRVLIAGTGSSSGKTMTTAALLSILKDKGLDPVAFKCGPDYIDPMFHKKVLGIDSLNLDTFLAGQDGVRELVLNAATSGRHYAVMEGVMGIYDGLLPDSTDGSCYEIASITNTPVILVVDASGVGRTVISLIKGVLADDFNKLIKGIILNKMSDGYYDKILPTLQDEISKDRPDVAILGHIPRSDDIGIDSRHLGLKLPGEIADINEKIARFAKIMETGCDITAILSIMNSLECVSKFLGFRENSFRHTRTLTLAVAQDEAFCFYYPQNLSLLEELGADIVYFSPLHDKTIPQNADVLLFGGGYPELHLSELAANHFMLESVQNAIKNGMPCIAECGGFMYLHDAIFDKNGIEYKMTGVIDGKCHYTGHLVNFGYTTITGCNNGSDLGSSLAGMRGHEFHYYDSTATAGDLKLCKLSSGKEYNGMILTDNCLLGWPHLYYPSKPEAVEAFFAHAGKEGS